MGNETPAETPQAGSDVKDLIAAVHELTQVKIAEATKPAVPGPTDTKTRPDFSVAPDASSDDDKEESLIGRVKSLFKPATKAKVRDTEGVEEVVTKGGLLPQPLSLAGYNSQKAGIASLKFPRGDYENFSLTRYCMAAQRVAAGFESSSAMSQIAPWETQYYEAAKSVKLYDPVLKANQGDMVSGQDGGFLAPEFWASNFFDQLYASQIVTQLPITTMRMGYRVQHMPKLTTAVSISYAAENATLATTVASFNQLSFTARKQGEIIQISNELIRDAVPAADSLLQNHAVKWMALDRDKQLILGNGQAGAPVGLWNIGGAATQNSLGIQNTTLATNASPLYSELLTGIINVETLNGLSTNVPIGQATCTGILGMPVLKKQILGIVDSNGRPLADFTGFNALRGPFPSSGGGYFDGLLGVDTYRFSQVFNQSANSRYITFGDWQWLIYMVRQDVEVMVSNVAGTSFANDQTWIRLISRYDVGVAHPEAFFGYTNG